MIIWLASYPKSGNTWMRALIEAWHGAVMDRLGYVLEMEMEEAA